MTKSSILFNRILFFAALSIITPIAIIILWAIAARWPWPLLLPERLSLRGISEVLGGHSKAVKLLYSNIVMSLGVAVISTATGFMSARAFCFYEFKGKNFLRFGSMLPVIVPANLFALGIHVFFIRLGLSDNMTGVVLCHVIYSLPYTINILTDSLENTGKKYEEQAAVLGCQPLKTFVNITLPMTFPAFLSAASMSYIISFSQYFITLLIGGGKVKTYSVVMVPFISGGDRTIASAYVMVFLFSSLLVFAIFDFLAKNYWRVDYEIKP